MKGLVKEVPLKGVHWIEGGYECEDRRILQFNNHWHLYRKIEDEYREIYRTESSVQAWRFVREDVDPR